MTTAPEGTIRVQRDGPRGWHVIERAKYEADPLAFVLVDEDGKPILEQTGGGIGGDIDLSDDQLRAAIKDATGKAPHHKLSRSKLIEAFNALSKTDDQDEEASNGLTRREIEADMTGMNVDFDPRDPLEDLAALRDLEREQRSQ